MHPTSVHTAVHSNPTQFSTDSLIQPPYNVIFRPASVALRDFLPISQLCRRSFGSSEMLRKHEKKSKLHKENLAAAAAAAREGGDHRG